LASSLERRGENSLHEAGQGACELLPIGGRGPSHSAIRGLIDLD
jgi:hypothetical protein